MLVHSGALALKVTKNTGGVAVMTQKKGHKVVDAVVYADGMLVKPHRHRTRNLPAAGSVAADDTGVEQLSF